MTHPIQEPVATESRSNSGGTKTVYKHPAYAQIRANRVTGGTTLYGSDFVHHNFITIAIARSELTRELAHDWHFARQDEIEVTLSEAQWATFVSSLNVGTGTPCTLTHLRGEVVPSLPYRNAADDHKKEVHAKITEATKIVDEAMKALDEELGPSLSSKKKAIVMERLTRLRRELGSNLPFVADSLDRHMEQTVEKAKIEVHAYANSVIQRTGLAALAGNALLQLGPGDSEGAP